MTPHILMDTAFFHSIPRFKYCTHCPLQLDIYTDSMKTPVNVSGNPWRALDQITVYFHSVTIYKTYNTKKKESNNVLCSKGSCP